MNNLEMIVCDWTKRPGATDDVVKQAEHELKIKLPLDYLDLMRRANGLEGFAGPVHYVIFWPISRLAEMNKAYSVAEFAPSLLLIGTDGGDTGYGVAGGTYVETPLIGMSDDSLVSRGRSLVELLSFLGG